MKTCTVQECAVPSIAKGLCRSHYNRQYYAGTTALAPVITACLHCSGPIDRKSAPGPAPSYCSLQCRRAKGYTAAKNSPAYLERRAKMKAAAVAHREVGTCKQCGNEWTKSRRDSSFCSQRCNTLWQDANGATCSEPDCDRGIRAQGVCSKHYKVQSRASGRMKPDVWDERRKANYQRRRALKITTAVEVIRPAEVYERDGWICQLCEQPVDQATAWPHPLSPSLDHDRPLSKGGTHTWDNVQLSHLRCNVSKGNRIAA